FFFFYFEIKRKNQAPDVRKISELTLQLSETTSKMQVAIQEKDALKRRLDTLRFEFKTLQDLYCLDQLQNQLLVDSSTVPFPTQETIVSMYQSLIRTHHSTLHQEFSKKLELKYPNTKRDINHELFIDYISYEFLYGIIIACYNKMKQRKNLFVQAAAELLQMSPQAVSLMISAGMQRSWKSYIGHTHDRNVYTDEELSEQKQNTHLIESQFSRTSIDDIIVQIAELAIVNYPEWDIFN
ncbi:hypothetical protein RFI_13466, partial [Reticulomyxa filosa]